MPVRRRNRPSWQGLVEYLVLVAVLVTACAGAVAILGDRLRSLLGLRPAAGARAPAGPAAPP